MAQFGAVGLALLGVATIAVTRQEPGTVESATQFLASLDRTQHRAAVMTVDDDYRTLWRFIPAQRQGVSWKGMTDEQEEKAMALLRSVLSEVGIKKTEVARELQRHLAEVEDNPTFRDHELYYFTFFGTPSETEEWGWRYDGHHLSLNFAYNGRTLVASTPQFFGALPAEIESGPREGLRMLPKEQDLGFAFLDSLTDEQRSKAIVSERAPFDMYTFQSRKVDRQKDEGIRYTDLTSDQQKSLLGLIRAHAESQRDDEAARRMGQIASVGHESVHFVWRGATSPGRPHYYRILGPTFLIEFDNAQTNANHIHTVWRDYEGDFGRDVLAEHHAAFDHSQE